MPDLAERLMLMAARKSTRSSFGWTHPDCVDLAEAARVIRGEPEPVEPDFIDGVLSKET